MKRLLSLFLLLCSGIALGDASIPKADIAGAKDSPLLGRYAGALIVSYETKEFDELTLPLGPLKRVADANKRDAHNNNVFEPTQSRQLEGRRTRLVYLLPAGVSPLQAIRNYQNDAAAKGGKTLFECKSPDCGGDPARTSSGGGGDQSIAMVLWPENRVKEAAFTNGNCAQTSRTSEQRYASLDLPKGNAVAAVLAFSLKDDLYCKAFHDRTVVIVDLLEQQAMAQKMVTVKAEEMAQAINTGGRVALYGLYFDSGKADVKPESRDTLEQIARLLTSNQGLNLLVVGHTDNVGGFAANMDLSRRRAEAVIGVLASQYKIDRKRLTPVGVSFASPVASNSSEDGKAKNRRVELVPNN
ncbi:OmpA family protein [Niveibacterium umoris]|uniref:Outer membrane protein OmpA-like peptidoglycan-associated protein n=1 Tax=Niveibacterium umoris TaxID=1193620 RepID=A0A840BBS3_9RHOO|nr:OmpA family protein [Niveibacterium umoris]MBB4010991.1 outer membrane protein OmpA-like peptidoglycan-associated protein [Niveibacterium umoris]